MDKLSSELEIFDEFSSKDQLNDILFDDFDWLCEEKSVRNQLIKPKKKYNESNQENIKVKKSENSLSNSIQITPGNKLTNDQKQAIQKTLAQKFMTIGFGYIINMKAVKKRHKIGINASYYNNTMSSIVRKTFRTLQNYLLKQCNQQNIKPISHSQGSLLRSPMLQCTKWLKKEELDTFYKFICRTYNLKKVYITQDQASTLYGQILRSTRKDHEISHIILHRNKKKSDNKNSQGMIFSYAPSSQIAKKVTNNESISIANKFVQH